MKFKSLIVSCWVLTGFIFASHGEAAASKAKVSGQINLNTATVEQIDQLPGVSPQKAQAVVEYRKEHPFKTVDELDNVKGFSPKSIEKIRTYLTTMGATTLVVEKGTRKSTPGGASAPAAPAQPESQKSATKNLGLPRQ